MGIKRNTLLSSSGLCHCQTDTEDSVGTEFGFVLGTIKLDQEIIDCRLIDTFDVLLDQSRSDY
jgi:hypothetical protein